MARHGYDVEVIETNIIAGETVSSFVRLFRARSLGGARDQAEQRWAGRPPQGARIRDTKDGYIYDLPRLD